MEKNKMLRSVLAATLLLLGAGSLHRAFAGSYFDVASVINVSSQTANPTLLFSSAFSAGDIRLVCTQLNFAGETILLQSSSTGFSVSPTTGTARMPCLPATVQQLDFFLDNYSGPLYAVANATYTIPVSVWRKR